MLAELEELARLIIPDGKKIGHEWVGYAADGRKWSVNVDGRPEKRGVSAVWSEGFYCDIVGLVVDGFCGGDFEAAMRWAYRRYHIGSARQSPADLKHQGDQAAQVAQERRRIVAACDARRITEAADIWKLPGDDRNAFAYLASRGLRGVPVRHLRFGEAVPYDKDGLRLPAMLAPVIDLDHAEFIGVHRTFLEPDANGGWRKLRKGEAKKSRGPVGGGIVPLLDGAGAPWRQWLVDPNRPTEPLVVGEGIENVLSASAAFPGCRACSFLSAAYLESMARALPRQADPIIFVADRDGAGRGREGIRKQRSAVFAHWFNQDRAVLVYSPPRGVKDANDALNALIHGHGYQLQFSNTPSRLDFHTVLAEAQAVIPGDAAALWFEAVTGARWEHSAELALRSQPALATIERPEVMLPAVIMPVVRLGRPVGAVVAWLASRGDAWTLAPLILPIRIVGDARGVVVLRKARCERYPARLVVGLESALVRASMADGCTVLCAIDAAHAARCAAGVPEDIDVCDLWTTNEDVTLGGEVFTRIARAQLNQLGLNGGRYRPWDQFSDFAAMLRDRDVEGLWR